MIITGEELKELQKHTGQMIEAFSLDRRIKEYKGTKQVSFYRWDLDCLIDVLSIVLDDSKAYPDRNSSSYMALKNLYEKLKSEYDWNFKK